MGWFGDDSFEAKSFTEVQTYNNESYQTNAPHKAKLSHEVIAGAAAYEAAKAYEDHAARNGHPDDHAKAKEIFAGFAGAFIDRVVETKGLDYIDRQKAKHHAKEASHSRFSEVEYKTEYKSEVYDSNSYGNYRSY